MVTPKNLHHQVRQENDDDADGSEVADEEKDDGVEADVGAEAAAVGEFVADGGRGRPRGTSRQSS